MASLTQIYCPCGCGATAAADSDFAVALRLHWPCTHSQAKPTTAPGIRYCHDCWHWIGIAEAFRALR